MQLKMNFFCLNVEMKEEVLIEKLKKQDRLAQKELFDKYKSLFYAIALRYASSKDEAKDILQETFMKIFANIKKYSGTGSFEGWMKKILVNHSINYFRRNSKHFFEDVEKVKDISYDEIYKQNDFSYEEIFEAIKQLPLGYRTIFNLYAIEGYKHKEIAEMLNISENTSKSQYHRAKLFLQYKLQQIKELKNEI